MVYGTIAALRKLSGGITSTTLDDTSMDSFLAYGTAKIESCSGVKDIDVSDGRYSLMTQGALYFASSAVRDHLKDVDKMADTHLSRAKDICQDIIGFNTSSTGSSQLTSISQGYKTYPLNPEGEVFGLDGFT